MFSRKPLASAIAAIVLGLATTVSTSADGNANHTMYVTFNQPVALPGVSLASGTYIFEVPEEVGDHSVVRVLSRDRSIVFLTTFTNAVSRPAGMTPNQSISFLEARAGRAQPISVWWPQESMGRQFVYPKH